MVDVAVPRRRVVIEALVLVFSRSEVRELVGTDALRTVVTGQYREIVVDRTLQLQPIWNLLADQPGFEADKAAPAFFLLETWKSELGLDVVLPAELASVAPDERKSVAARCSVASSDKDAVFANADPQTPVPTPRPSDEPPARKTSKTSKLEVDEVAGKRGGGSRPALEIAAALVAAVAFTFVGITVYRACAEPGFEEVKVALPAELPVGRTERIGSELHATLTDQSWLGLPAAERQEVMREALEDLRSQGIEILVVVGAKGETLASAQWVGEPPRPVVKLR